MAVIFFFCVICPPDSGPPLKGSLFFFPLRVGIILKGFFAVGVALANPPLSRGGEGGGPSLHKSCSSQGAFPGVGGRDIDR